MAGVASNNRPCLHQPARNRAGQEDQVEQEVRGRDFGRCMMYQGR